MSCKDGLAIAEKLAVFAGKLSASTIRMMGLGLASNLPGKISRRIAPSLLGHLSAKARRGVIAVSGTNGKSTTSGLVAAILRRAGMKLVHNRQGANLVTGITACVVDASSWTGDLDADYCLFEIDEAALPVVAKEVAISHVLVTNLFRDQLDRFGELDTTARLISRGIIQNDSSAVLNADDPNVAQMVPECNRVFYGIRSSAASQALPELLAGAGRSDPESAANGLNARKEVHDRDQAEASYSVQASDGSELSYCAGCGEEYRYSLRFYGQLGHYRCPSCGNTRPQPDVAAEDVAVRADGSSFSLVYGEERLEINLPLPGLFNVYNALAAAALCLRLGIEREAIKSGLCEYSTLFGRSEKVVLKDRHVLIQLIKNPAGASQAVQAASADGKGKFLIAINDNYADGRDVSWLWDADFEALAACSGPFVVSGQRCHDMALRLKYAGVDPSLITVEASLDQALDLGLALCAEDEMLWLMPTYTCLLDLQKIMKTRGCPLAGT